MELKLNDLYPFKLWIASLLIGAAILFFFSFSLPTFIV